MLYLYLLRHAKSSWDQPSLRDFDRPLSARGQEIAPLMGEYMNKHGYHPDCILCSPSKRTAQTLALAHRHLPDAPEAMMNGALYHADAGRIVDMIRQSPSKASRLLVIGHNPGMQETALMLTGGGDQNLWRSMWAKFPTAALAVLRFDISNWTEISPREGELENFTKPKDL